MSASALMTGFPPALAGRKPSHYLRDPASLGSGANGPESAQGGVGLMEDDDTLSGVKRGVSKGVSDIDTDHPRTLGLSIEEDMSSPYAPTLRALHKQRAVLEVELQKVMTAIAGLEALDRTTRRRVALGGNSLLFQGLELQARTARAAAETVLRRVGTPLAGGELRKLIEQGGRPITYRALYNMLKKRKSVFRQLPDKRWSLIVP
jgi:hypothetical protein